MSDSQIAQFRAGGAQRSALFEAWINGEGDWGKATLSQTMEKTETQEFDDNFAFMNQKMLMDHFDNNAMD
eukprot:4607696-Alexandrium_andersonii.AAC.1